MGMIDNHTRVLIGVLADDRINDPAKAATVQKLLDAHDTLATEQHQLKDCIAQLEAERDTLRAALEKVDKAFGRYHKDCNKYGDLLDVVMDNRKLLKKEPPS